MIKLTEAQAVMFRDIARGITYKNQNNRTLKALIRLGLVEWDMNHVVSGGVYGHVKLSDEGRAMLREQINAEIEAGMQQVREVAKRGQVERPEGATIVMRADLLSDGQVFSPDMGATWYVCAVPLFGNVAVYVSDDRDPDTALTVRVDVKELVMIVVPPAPFAGEYDAEIIETRTAAVRYPGELFGVEYDEAKAPKGGAVVEAVPVGSLEDIEAHLSAKIESGDDLPPAPFAGEYDAEMAKRASDTPDEVDICVCGKRTDITEDPDEDRSMHAAHWRTSWSAEITANSCSEECADRIEALRNERGVLTVAMVRKARDEDRAKIEAIKELEATKLNATQRDAKGELKLSDLIVPDRQILLAIVKDGRVRADVKGGNIQRLLSLGLVAFDENQERPASNLASQEMAWYVPTVKGYALTGLDADKAHAAYFASRCGECGHLRAHHSDSCSQFEADFQRQAAYWAPKLTRKDV